MDPRTSFALETTVGEFGFVLALIEFASLDVEREVAEDEIRLEVEVEDEEGSRRMTRLQSTALVRR